MTGDGEGGGVEEVEGEEMIAKGGDLTDLNDRLRSREPAENQSLIFSLTQSSMFGTYQRKHGCF